MKSLPRTTVLLSPIALSLRSLHCLLVFGSQLRTRCLVLSPFRPSLLSSLSSSASSCNLHHFFPRSSSLSDFACPLMREQPAFALGESCHDAQRPLKDHDPVLRRAASHPSYASWSKSTKRRIRKRTTKEPALPSCKSRLMLLTVMRPSRPLLKPQSCSESNILSLVRSTRAVCRSGCSESNAPGPVGSSKPVDAVRPSYAIRAHPLYCHHVPFFNSLPRRTWTHSGASTGLHRLSGLASSAERCGGTMTSMYCLSLSSSARMAIGRP